MMKKPNTIEKELNEIRLDFYEKTKGLSPSEMNEYIRSHVSSVHQKHGIQTISTLKTERKAVL